MTVLYVWFSGLRCLGTFDWYFNVEIERLVVQHLVSPVCSTVYAKKNLRDVFHTVHPLTQMYKTTCEV